MPGDWVDVCIGLGSNLEPREGNLDAAVKLLEQVEGIRDVRVSSYYNTAPVGYLEQPDFLNAVVRIWTVLNPDELLSVCQDIESSLKRVRNIRWGPRTIDLDILLYGNMIIDKSDLTVPHPRLHEREFVLIPLNEIAGEMLHPAFGKTMSTLLHELKANKT